jgi:hypothetical protein
MPPPKIQSVDTNRPHRADFLAELRGFEPLTSAVGARGDGAAASASAFTASCRDPIRKKAKVGVRVYRLTSIRDAESVATILLAPPEGGVGSQREGRFGPPFLLGLVNRGRDAA